MKERKPLVFFGIIISTIFFFMLSITLYSVYKNNSNNHQKEIVINLESLNQLHYIDVFVNGSIKKFILDTGASESTISENDLRGINYRKIGSAFYIMANGDTINCNRIIVDSISINDLYLNNFTFAVIKTNTQNLLGKNFLNSFKKWSIDNKSNQLKIVK